MIEDLSEYITTHVTIDDVSYPVTKMGNGPIPCLVIGIGSLMQRTLPDSFREKFTVYATDLYWTQGNALADPASLTMGKIIDDIFEVARQLDLEDYMLMGHSCFGIVAIEAAKRQPEQLKGVMAVATAPSWGVDGNEIAINYFEEHASDERKENHRLRRERFERIRAPGESEVSVNGYEADSAKYWGNYHIDRATLEALWRGCEADDAMMNRFFGEILPAFGQSLGTEINNVTRPVVVFGSEHDYDSAPPKSWDNFPKPSHFLLADCGATGHWPHYEDPEAFDRELTAWLDEYLWLRRSACCLIS